MDIKELQHLAELSKLELSSNENELQSFICKLDNMIELVDKIKNADINGERVYDMVDMTDLREDIPEQSTPRETLLQNAPNKKNGTFVVPRIME